MNIQQTIFVWLQAIEMSEKPLVNALGEIAPWEKVADNSSNLYHNVWGIDTPSERDRIFSTISRKHFSRTGETRLSFFMGINHGKRKLSSDFKNRSSRN